MEAIKYYVKGAFQDVKETLEVLEQQEELIADLTAKVADLVVVTLKSVRKESNLKQT